MLTIQKLISLIEPDKCAEFKAHLAATGNTLPLRLVDALEKYGPLKAESEQLCIDVYGTADDKAKRKFFQLAHYTFRLTVFLARRYPFYLTHNLSVIEKLFNTGKHDEAMMVSENLLDIAIKIEDYSTQTWVLKFLINFSHIREKRKEAIRQQQMLNSALSNEAAVNEILLYIRENLNFKDKNTITGDNAPKHIEFFKRWKEHPSFTARVLGMYGYCYTYSFLDDKQFYTQEVRVALDEMISELDKNSYVIFPFADDVLLNIDYLYMKHLFQEMNEEEILKESARLTRKWSTLRFWQTHINTAQIVSLSLQASYYLTHYCIPYKENYQDFIPAAVREQLAETTLICEKLIDQMREEKDAHVRLINLNNIYCAFLLLNGKENIQKSISILEGLLINYQQIPFQKLYDAIFANLVIGYFSLRDHNGVSECYRRYEKLTARKAKIEENDIAIKAFYYASQWLQNKRDQYVEKLKGLLRDCQGNPALSSTEALIRELTGYFGIPV
jgi:hypothetical protein